jgi:hypothetical protein
MHPRAHSTVRIAATEHHETGQSMCRWDGARS